MTKKELDIKTSENWLWEAAFKIRGDIDAPKYKDYILSLIFIKRLSDFFEDEIGKNDYNLSPSRYVASNDEEKILPLEEAVVFLIKAEEGRRKADEKFEKILKKLGFEI